jgi:hypothetical protein
MDLLAAIDWCVVVDALCFQMPHEWANLVLPLAPGTPAKAQPVRVAQPAD